MRRVRTSTALRAASPGLTTGALALALVLGGGSAMLGCDGEPLVMPDAGPGRDAALFEAGTGDSATFDGGAPSDGGVAVDAGPAAVCTMGDCDPRVFGCGDGGGVCTLRDRLPMCTMTAGAGERGSACTIESECGPGLACFRDTAERGICAEVCCPGTTTCPTGEVCSADGVLVNAIATDWGRCAPPQGCDVLMSECAPREGCYIVYPDPGDPECRLAGAAEVGDDCSVPQDCQAGLFCAGIGSPKTCVRVCRVGVASSCPIGEGDCVAQAYSPAGSGVCVASTGFAP